MWEQNDIFKTVVENDYDGLVQIVGHNACNSLVSYISMQSRWARQQEDSKTKSGKALLLIDVFSLPCSSVTFDHSFDKIVLLFDVTTIYSKAIVYSFGLHHITNLPVNIYTLKHTIHLLHDIICIVHHCHALIRFASHRRKS